MVTKDSFFPNVTPNLSILEDLHIKKANFFKRETDNFV